MSVRGYRDASEETAAKPKGVEEMLKIVGLCRSARNTKVARHRQSRTGSIASTESSLSPKSEKVSLTIIKFGGNENNVTKV